MARRIEQNIFDRLLNGKLFGKRKISLPLKYYYEAPRLNYRSRYSDALYFPKSKFDKLFANLFERCLPGLKYFVWDEQVRWAREWGYTLGERMYHSMRQDPNISLHAMGQQVHPWGWLEAQRRDAFIRKVAVSMPGISVPDWAFENRRGPDYDLNSILGQVKAVKEVFRESTPSQQIEAMTYINLHHLFSEKHFFGYAGQRLFYNEDVKGEWYKNGEQRSSDKKIIHGWYADAQNDSQKQRIDFMSEQERQEYEKNVERWDKNFKEFFPEVSSAKYNPVLHKYDEAYYERNMSEIRSAVFANLWINSVDKFNQEEIQNIHEFFLNERTEVFFEKEDEHSEYKGTELYNKFVEVLNFPNFFEIDKFTTYTPEMQFYDLMDRNWGINFDTVETYRNRYAQLIKSDPSTSLSSLVKEEVFNPLYRVLLKEKYGYELSQNESFVMKAASNKVSEKDLQELAQTATENVWLCNPKVLESMVNSQVRKIVKTFHFEGGL